VDAGLIFLKDNMMDIPRVENFLMAEVSASDDAELSALSRIVFTPEMCAAFVFPKSAPPPPVDWPAAQAARLFLIREEGRIVSACNMFPRRIQTARGVLDVLALAGVKTHPDFRLRGHGAAVVRAAFQHVDNGAFCASLFQTGVPGFYEKLGCRCVGNVFTNRLAENPAATPWWDKHCMVYPAAYTWPEGPVDLIGPAW